MWPSYLHFSGDKQRSHSQKLHLHLGEGGRGSQESIKKIDSGIVCLAVQCVLLTDLAAVLVLFIVSTSQLIPLITATLVTEVQEQYFDVLDAVMLQYLNEPV